MPPHAARRNRFSRGEAGRPTGLTEVEFGQKCWMRQQDQAWEMPHCSKSVLVRLIRLSPAFHIRLFHCPPIRAMKNPPSPREKAWPPAAAGKRPAVCFRRDRRPRRSFFVPLCGRTVREASPYKSKCSGGNLPPYQREGR